VLCDQKKTGFLFFNKLQSRAEPSKNFLPFSKLNFLFKCYSVRCYHAKEGRQAAGGVPFQRWSGVFFPLLVCIFKFLFSCLVLAAFVMLKIDVEWIERAAKWVCNVSDWSMAWLDRQSVKVPAIKNICLSEVEKKIG
jgi:hypothetical protein